MFRTQKFEKTKTQEENDILEKAMVEECESNLKILGATAIEDKLQDAVPQTISRLQ